MGSALGTTRPGSKGLWFTLRVSIPTVVKRVIRVPPLALVLGRNLLTVAAGLVAFRVMTRVDRDGGWGEPVDPPVEAPADPDPLLELARGADDRREPDPRWFR
jgi:hypothetical protein